MYIVMQYTESLVDVFSLFTVVATNDLNSRSFSGDISLSYALVRQAETCIQGNANDVTVTDSDIFACETGIALDAGSSRGGTDITALQPDDYFLRDSRVMYHTNAMMAFGNSVNHYFNVMTSQFSDNSNDGIQLAKWDDSATIEISDIATHLMMSDCRVERNGRSGIRDELPHSVVTIDGTVFSDIDDDAYYNNEFYEDAYVIRFAVTNSVFTRCRGGIYMDGFSRDRDSAQNTFLLRNNIFEHFISDASVSLDSWHALNATIEGNTFREMTSCCSSMYIYLESGGDITFADNTFANNSQDAFRIYGSQEAIGTVNITGNTFTQVGRSRNIIEISHVTANIERNIFENTPEFGDAVIFIESEYDHVIRENQFTNNVHTPCLIEISDNLLYDRNKSIVANYNYWGTDNIRDIQDVICDFFLESRKAQVEISVYYTSVDMATTVTVISNDFRYEVKPDIGAVVIGGVMTSSVDMQELAGNYSLLVNRSLVIESGVDVQWHSVAAEVTSRRGIHVHGLYFSYGKLP